MRKETKSSYKKTQGRLKRRLDSLQQWVTDPKQYRPKVWYEYENDKAPQGVPLERQIPIHLPDREITAESLSAHLKQEQQQNKGQRLLLIPLFINNQWAVLSLYFDNKNQLCSANYADSVKESIQATQQHPIDQMIKSVYPHFKDQLHQKQAYFHSDPSLSEFIMVENAGHAVKLVYFGNHISSAPRLWSDMPTPTTHPDVSAFETELPYEMQLYVANMLLPKARTQFSRSSQLSYAIADDATHWKSLYTRWTRYLIPTTPNSRQPDCYKTAFKRLYFTLLPEERMLIKAAIAGDQATLHRFIDKPEQRNLLLAIAASHGDIPLLNQLKCKASDLGKSLIVSCSKHALNRQEVLNYFWSLISADDSFLTSDNYNSLAHWAAMLNQKDILTQILNENSNLAHQLNPQGITPLMFAKFFEHQSCVRILEKSSVKSGKGIAITSKPSTSLNLTLKSDHINSCLVLLAQGVNLNGTPNNTRRNHFFFVANLGCTITIDVLHLLFAHGANADSLTANGVTLLVDDLNTSRNARLTHFLLAYGANPHLKDNHRKPIVSSARYKGNSKIDCMLAIAKFLKPSSKEERSTLQDAHDVDPEYFNTLTQEILSGQTSWVWVTDEMRERMKLDPSIPGYEYQKKIQSRLKKRFDQLQDWLANPEKGMVPNTWPKPKAAPKGIPLDNQLPIYQPNKKILYRAKESRCSLTAYLKDEKGQHSKERLLLIPLYVKDHWTVLFLHINKDDQLVHVAHIDSIKTNTTQSDQNNLLCRNLYTVYPDFKGPIQQHQRYYHPDNSPSRFVMIKNAQEMIKHFYFEHHFPLTPIPWSTMPTDAFDTELPDELLLRVTRMLGLKARAQLSKSSRINHRVGGDKSLWKGLYQNWSRYVIPETPNAKEPKCYKSAFKILYVSLPPQERTLINAVITGDRATLQCSINVYELRNRLLAIAACHGDIKLLRTLKCKSNDLRYLALIQYSSKSTNRQAVLDYFWEVCNGKYSNNGAHYASMFNQTEKLQEMLEEYPELANRQNIVGITPRMIAEYYGHTACIKIIDTYQNRQDAYQNIWKDANSISKALVKAAKNDYNNWDIHNILILLAQGADPNYEDKGSIALARIVKGRSLDATRLLLTNGADPSNTTAMGNSPLDVAIRYQSVKQVRLLLVHGANPFTKTTRISYQSYCKLTNTHIRWSSTLKCWSLLNIAMFLKPEKDPTGLVGNLYSLVHSAPSNLKNSYDIDPNLFKTHIQDIIEHDIFPWVTDEMKERLLKHPLVRSLNFTNKREEEEEKGESQHKHGA